MAFTESQRAVADRAVADALRGLRSRGAADAWTMTDGLGDRVSPQAAAKVLGAVWLALDKETRDFSDLEPGRTLPQGGGRGADFRMLDAIRKVFGPDLDAQTGLRKYARYYEAVIPAVQKAAIDRATKMLAAQADVLKRLAPEMAEPLFQQWMHKAADHIVTKSSDCVASALAPQLKHQAALPITSPRSPNDLVEVLDSAKQLCMRRASDHFERNDPPAQLAELEFRSQGNAFGPAVALHVRHVEIVRILRSAPQFPEIVLAYARSAKDGTVATQHLLAAAIEGMVEFSDTLRTHPSHVWKYPGLVRGGAMQLDLHEVPGFSPYLLKLGKVKAEKDPTKLLTAVGMALAVLMLAMVGGPPPAGVLVFDFILGGASAAFSIVEERGAQVAADASMLMPDETKFAAEFRGYGGTALMVGLALATGISAVRGMPNKASSAIAREGSEVLPAAQRASGPVRGPLPQGMPSPNVTADELAELMQASPEELRAVGDRWRRTQGAAVKSRADQVLATSKAEFPSTAAVAHYSSAGSKFSLSEVPYGNDDLSKFAQDVRRELGLKRGGNVAVYEFENLPEGFRQLIRRQQAAEALRSGGAEIRVRGNLVAFVNLPGFEHSEQFATLLVGQGRRANYPLQVRRIYSELNPCADKCLPLLRQSEPGAEVTWSFRWDWDTNWPARDAAIAALFK